MMLFNANMKMEQVIHSNYLLIPVMNRFGIHLGFGEKTVQALCIEQNIDPDFFVTILNTYNNEHYFPEKKLKDFNILTIVNYLRQTHKYYLSVIVPRIQRHIDALTNTCQSSCQNLELVKSFFGKYVSELYEHIQREEQETFPYIISLYEMKQKGFDEILFHKLTSSYSMEVYDKQHDNIDDKLCDLKNILIKYLNGSFDENLCATVVFDLFRLEKDIQDHTRIEDKILQPMVIELENDLKPKNTQKRAKR